MSEWTTSVSAALHTLGRWTFAFTAIFTAMSTSASASTYTWQLPAAAYITGTVACSLSASFSPSPPRGMTRSTRPSADAIWRSSSRSPPVTGEIEPAGRPAASTDSTATAAEHGVRVRRHRRPAQHDRVAGLDAERRAVDRDVRARLVDDRDDAHRHEHLLEPDPVRQRALLDHVADRVGQRGHVADVAARSPRAAARPAAAGRDSEALRPALAARLHVALVRLEDLGRALLDRVGERLERAVLRLACRAWRACARQPSPARRYRLRMGSSWPLAERVQPAPPARSVSVGSGAGLPRLRHGEPAGGGAHARGGPAADARGAFGSAANGRLSSARECRSRPAPIRRSTAASHSASTASTSRFSGRPTSSACATSTPSPPHRPCGSAWRRRVGARWLWIRMRRGFQNAPRECT